MNQLTATTMKAVPYIDSYVPLDSVEYAQARREELGILHAELLELMQSVRLVDQPGDGGTMSTALDPTATQRQASVELLERYRIWFGRVHPFLARSPSAPTDALEEGFVNLASYFALRRVGAGISHHVWRELFVVESTQAIDRQKKLIDQALHCFSILDPHPRLELSDLTLRFVPVDEVRFHVFAESVLGEADIELTLPFDDRELENFILRYCDPSRGPVRGWTPTSIKPYASFGGKLFAALFNGGVRDLYMRHHTAIAAGQSGLRLRLKLGAAPQLTAVPWEFLYDSSDFIALTGTTTITRQLEFDTPIRPLRETGPLRILVSVSAPNDLSSLDSANELELLKTKLAPLVAADKVRVAVTPDGTVATLAAMLADAEAAGKPFHAWHFIGHGKYDDSEQGTFLAFENATGGTRLTSGFDLGTLLAGHPSTRVAVLNACEGARAAPEDSLTSVGAALVARGLPAAVAMQFSISDSAAIVFSDEFYRAIANGTSVEVAVTSARRRIFFTPNESEWATPVVLLRGSEEVLV